MSYVECDLSGRHTQIHPVIYTLQKIDGIEFYVAGGYVRSLICGNKDFSDIDLFFSSEIYYNKAYAYLSRYWYNTVSTKSAETFENKMNYKIQLIKFKYFASAVELIDSFDFTCTQFALSVKKDQIKATYAPTGPLDVSNKALIPHKITYPTASLQRLLKYTQNYGYSVCNGAMAEIVKQIRTAEEENINRTYVD